MIISCPQCVRSFQVEDAAFLGRPEGRRVRCSGCSYQWMQHGPQEEVPVVEVLIIPPQPRPKPVAKKILKSPIIKTWFLFLLTFLMVLVGSLVLLRHHMALTWPRMAPFYRTLGLPVVVSPADFVFKTVGWGKKRVDGNLLVRVKGEIAYRSEKEVSRPVPAIEILIYGPGVCPPQGLFSKITNGTDPNLARGLCLLDQWTFQPQVAAAIPGEVIPFQTEHVLANANWSPQVVVAEFQDS